MARVKIDIQAKKENFDSGINSMKQSLEQLKGVAETTFAAVGLEKGIEIAKELSKEVMEMGKNLYNSSMRNGISSDDLQVLKQAAKDSGSEYEKVLAILDKIAVARAKALKGDDDKLSNFANLNIDRDKLNKSTPYQLLTENIGGFIKKNGTGKNADDLSALMGKGWGSSVPLLKMDLHELKKEMTDNGSIMGADTIGKLKALDAALDSLKTRLIIGFADPLIKAVDLFCDGVARYLSLIDGTYDEKFGNKDKSKDKGFLSNAWDTTKGVASGLVGLGSVALGGGGAFGQDNFLYQFGVDELGKADELFHGAGADGVISAIADTMVAEGNISDKFLEWNNARKKNAEKAAENLKNPPKHDDSIDEVDKPEKATKVKKAIKETIYSDSFIKSGNFLGASFSTFGSVVTETDLAKTNNAQNEKIITRLDTLNTTVKTLQSSGALDGY